MHVSTVVNFIYFITLLESLAVPLAIALHVSTPHSAVPTIISDRLTAMPGLKRKNEATASTTGSSDANTSAKDDGNGFFPSLYAAD